MDLKQLKALVAVADHGTFSAAADALDTVQSNVSTHVARLEKEVGAILVDRAGGRLTAEGAAVVERARRIQHELDSLVSEVAAFREEVTGNARLGMIGTTARWLSPSLLDAMADQHPGVHLVIVDATSTSLEPQLASGRLDLAVVNLPMPAPDLMTTPLFDEDLLLVVPDTHPLASAGHADMGDLADLDLLLPAPGTAFRQEIDAAARAEGVVLRPRAELDGVRLIASLTIDGRGPAILPATALPGWVQGRWVGIPVLGLPRRRVGLAQRRRGLPSPSVRALLGVLRQVVSDGLEGEAGLHVPAADA